MDEQRIIYFLRHGMTYSNFYKQYCGWSDAPLLKEETERLKCSAKQLSVDNVWSSDLSRSVQTAELLFPELPVSRLKSLREIYFGDFEGKTYEELKENKAYQEWISDFSNTAPLNGESLTNFHQRIRTGWETIKQSSQKKIAVITHSGWIREWCGLYVPHLTVNNLWYLPFGGGLAVRFDLKGGDWRCISLQEVHLTEKRSGC
ncbi:histidine phosphatase family protein [Alteribacillus sp. JSM 102045]|uniref:histidine phosphatase family protein n=1 Tax=Alteribacillus sp. JSM 102045 TaxID=1562101 RepID=UPI0035C1AED0